MYMWSNLPEGGAGTNRKQSSVIIPVSFVGLIATKNLVNLQFNHETNNSHTTLLSELKKQKEALLQQLLVFSFAMYCLFFLQYGR